MNYSLNYFSKNLNNLEYPDILTYFTSEQEESTTIEFKSYSATYGNMRRNLEGVIRGICAFLNSEGGIIIWGAPEGTEVAGRQEKVFIGELSPVTELIEKDRLINIISDSIKPMPIGIDVKVISHEETYIYIFEVQKSNYSPHQYKDIYYARLDGQTKPAPNYLIEALYRKITYPNLEGFIRFDKISNDGTYYYLDTTIFIFNFTELQNEENVSYRLLCAQGIFTNSLTVIGRSSYTQNGHQFLNTDNIKILHAGTPDMHSERLRFNPYEVLNNNNIVDLVLTFGGKNSPMKLSFYKLDFGLIDWNNTDNPNYLISELSENELSSKRRQNTSKEDILRGLLKR